MPYKDKNKRNLRLKFRFHNDLNYRLKWLKSQRKYRQSANGKIKLKELHKRKIKKYGWQKRRMPLTTEYRQLILDLLRNRDGEKCNICNKKLNFKNLSEINIHHKIEMAYGGLNISKNICLTHKKCNMKKESERKQKETKKLYLIKFKKV